MHMSNSGLFLALALALLCVQSHSFVVITGTGALDARAAPLAASNAEELTATRKQFMSVSSAFLISTAASLPSLAENETTAPVSSPTTNKSIAGCVKAEPGKPNNCVSTSSVRQVDLYSPPWTFEVSPDEAFARLKGAIASDSSLTVTDIDEDYRYIKLDAITLRSGITSKDEIEFIVKGDDKVVTFKSYEKDAKISDFGAQRSKLEALRKSGGVFDVMGAGLTADSYGDVSKGRGGGALGQLKAFYGLQSGAGFEEVFE